MKLHSATIQIEYFPTDMVLPYHVCCALRRFKLLSQRRIKLHSVTIQMKATENYFAVALLVMLYRDDSGFYGCGRQGLCHVYFVLGSNQNGEHLIHKTVNCKRKRQASKTQVNS